MHKVNNQIKSNQIKYNIIKDTNSLSSETCLSIVARAQATTKSGIAEMTFAAESGSVATNVCCASDAAFNILEINSRRYWK